MYSKKFFVFFILIEFGLLVNGVKATGQSVGTYKKNDILRDEDRKQSINLNQLVQNVSQDDDIGPNSNEDAGDANDDNDSDADDDDEPSIEVDVMQLSLKDQVRVLAREVNAMKRQQRRDRKSLEMQVQKSVRKATKPVDRDEMNIRRELEQLR